MNKTPTKAINHITYAYPAPPETIGADPHPRGITVAIIPARGNSKGIPRKNMRELAGKPLIGWTIDTALALDGFLDRILVTTEDKEITRYAANRGITVIGRPPYLSADEVQTDEVCLDALRQIQYAGDVVGTVVVLQPTSPLRTPAQVRQALALHHSKPNHTVVSATIDYGYHWRNEKTDYDVPTGAYPLDHDPLARTGRQWRERGEQLWSENGAIYIANAERMAPHKTYRAPPFVLFEMDAESSVDIDTEEDWGKAERLLERRA